MMNFRHVASLALVGWYLMAPPMTSDHKIRDDAPIAQWQMVDSFDDAGSCHDSRFRVMRNMKSAAECGYQRALHSACISTDDPRLKAK